MKSVSYSWATSTNSDGTVSIREGRRVGTVVEYTDYEPMPAKLADAFVRARRDSISRLMSREGNIRLFLH